MRPRRIVALLFLSLLFTLGLWYRSLPSVVLLADGLFLETEWAQGEHDLFLPLLKKGWRFRIERVDRLPLEKDALTALMDSFSPQMLVTSPRLTLLVDQWHISQPSYRLVGIAQKPVEESAFDVVLRQDLTQGYGEMDFPARMISSSPVPDDLKNIFSQCEMVDGKGSDVYVKNVMEGWKEKSPATLVVYEVANLSLYQGVKMVVPSGMMLSLANEQIAGVIVSDFSPIASFAVPLNKSRKTLTLTLESHYRSGARMRGGYRAQALAAWGRKFL